MRWTQTLIPTLRNIPKDAEADSHKLALRSGLIRQLSSGVYSYLPLGFRVLKKVMQIIREEMARAGAEELLMPALHPAELWKKTGRYETLGDDKIAFKNRAGHEFVLGPTHEEVVTELVGGSIKSFRDLPVTVYQLQTKFRDEARPRFGVIRTKEFIMKDAYSFDRDLAGLDASYQKMSDAYHKIFTRCGVQFKVVTADSGMMGGSMSQEFMVECPYGEDKVAMSESGYLASMDIAKRNWEVTPCDFAELDIEKVVTPDARTIDEVSHYLRVRPSRIIKTLIYVADDKLIAALVTGDSEVNEAKLRKLVEAQKLRPATPEEIEKFTGAPVGFAGPVKLNMPIYADFDLMSQKNFVTGANEKDKHLKNVNMGRDFTATLVHDIRFVKEGDTAPDGSGTKLKLTTTMEVGHIFKLGTRYTKALGVEMLDEKGERVPVIMGCYGIGVNRILAAAIEEHHDEKGIKWPAAIAPFDVEVIPVNQADAPTREAAEKIYEALTKAGKEVLYDDRDERAGVKFNDADLLGIPVQIIVGERGLKEDQIEIKLRSKGVAEKVSYSAFLKNPAF